MAQTKQEFHVGETVYVREDVDDMPYGYTPEMKRLRGSTATISRVSLSDCGRLYYVEEIPGYCWHACCFSKIERELPEFEGGTISDLLSIL